MARFIKQQLLKTATLRELNMCADYIIFVTGIESCLAIPDIKEKQEFDNSLKLCYVS